MLCTAFDRFLGPTEPVPKCSSQGDAVGRESRNRQEIPGPRVLGPTAGRKRKSAGTDESAVEMVRKEFKEVPSYLIDLASDIQSLESEVLKLNAEIPANTPLSVASKCPACT